jgi:hypothetical protein
MKTIKHLLFFVVLFLTQVGYSQSCKTSGTTMEEYNYIVKGYKVQMESGLDMKKGYDFKEIKTVDFDGRKVVYKELIKDGKDLRAIMAIFTGKNGLTSYFCVPLGECSNEIKDACFNSVSANVDNMQALNFYQYSLASVLNKYLSK